MLIVIDGAGEVGSHLAKMLSREDNEIAVIDNDEQRLAALTATADVEPIKGSPSSISALREAEVDKADLFIAVYPKETQEVNIVSAMLAKRMGAAKVIARVNDVEYLNPENKLMFKEMGIELTFCPEKIAADEIVEQIHHSSTADTVDFAHGELQIAVFRLSEMSPLVDLKLIEFTQQLSKDEADQFRIIAISRDEKTIIPKFDTKFQFGDLVYTISRRESIDLLAKHLNVSDLKIENVMIMGGSQIAEMAAATLCDQIDSVKIIDRDHDRCVELSENLDDKVQVVCGDGRDSSVLSEEGIRDCDTFLALTGNDETNVLACVMAKKFGVPRTIAEVEKIEYIRLAEEMGVDTVINKKLITAGRIYKFTLSGKGRLVRNMSGTNAEVMEYTVAPGSAITKAALKDLDFPTGAVIGGVVRGTESFIAVGDTRIEAYDKVAVFALPETIKETDKFFK